MSGDKKSPVYRRRMQLLGADASCCATGRITCMFHCLSYQKGEDSN